MSTPKSTPGQSNKRRQRSPFRSPSPNIARVDTKGSLVKDNIPTHRLNDDGTQEIYTSIANNQCWSLDRKFYMVNLPVYSDDPVINRFLELTTTLLINPVGDNFDEGVNENVKSAKAGLQQGAKTYDKLSDGIYTFMTCYNTKDEIMIFLMKANTIFEFGTKHIQMLHRARKILGISALDSLKIWYTGEILKTADGIKYNFMSGTFSMQKYTGTEESLKVAKRLVETILARLGHTDVEYTDEVLLTSKTLPLNYSDLVFFKKNRVGVYEFDRSSDCHKFNSAVQSMNLADMNAQHLEDFKKLEKFFHTKNEEIPDNAITVMFHTHQDELAQRTVEILQTYNGTIYTYDDKMCGGILGACMTGGVWLKVLYEKLKNIMPWRKKPRVGGRRTNKMKMRKFRPRTRRNRTRRYGGRK
jgi:hypothetical protein